MKRVAAALAEKWHKPYGEVMMCWLRVRLQFALADLGCGPTTWDEEGFSLFWCDGWGWHGFGVLGRCIVEVYSPTHHQYFDG